MRNALFPLRRVRHVLVRGIDDRLRHDRKGWNDCREGYGNAERYQQPNPDNHFIPPLRPPQLAASSSALNDSRALGQGASGASRIRRKGSEKSLMLPHVSN
jgi:hypothetical protein